MSQSKQSPDRESINDVKDKYSTVKMQNNKYNTVFVRIHKFGLMTLEFKKFSDPWDSSMCSKACHFLGIALQESENVYEYRKKWADKIINFMNNEITKCTSA